MIKIATLKNDETKSNGKGRSIVEGKLLAGAPTPWVLGCPSTPQNICVGAEHPHTSGVTMKNIYLGRGCARSVLVR